MNELFAAQLNALRSQYLQKLPTDLNDILHWYHQLPTDNLQVQQAIMRQIHTVKGTAGTLGFAQVSDSASQLELLLAEFFRPDAEKPAVKTLRFAMQQLRQAVQDAPTVFAALQPAVASEATPGRSSSESTEPKRSYLLLMEDDKLQAKVLSSNLREFGFVIEICHSLQAAEQQIERELPALLLADLTMAGSTEQQVFELIAKLHQRQIPSIVLSARNEFTMRMAAVRAKAAAYYLKSVKINDLVNKIRDLLEISTEKPYRILMIDDQAAVIDYYRALLEHHGFTFKSMKDPTNLMDVLQEYDPDLFLLDFHLEEYSGAEIAGLIRQFPKLESTPIVFLTAESAEQLKTDLVELGSDDVIGKSIAAASLISQLTSRIKRGRRLRLQMKQDSLTQLYNHGYMQNMAQQLFALSQRNHNPCCVVMIDLDHFKSVNDRFGHAAGDRVLTAVAQLLQQRLRKSDAVGRYGGEEFILLLPDTPLEDAVQVIENIRLKFSQLAFTELEQTFQCTFSAGITCSLDHSTVQECLDGADKLLYQAKHAGRNQLKW